MADFNLAIPITLEHEGGFFHNLTTGEVVNMGVTLATLRSLGILKTSGLPTTGDIAFVRGLTMDEVEQIYREQYWNHLELDQINDQAVAAKVFDLAVNMGVVTAARILQQAVGVPADGIVGPHTIGAANATDPVALLGMIQSRAATQYQQIAIANPALAEDLPGWLRRLNS